MPLHHEAWRYALSQAGAEFEFSWELFVSRAGMSLVRTVEELNGQFQTRLNAELIAAEQYKRYKQLEARVQPVAEVVAFAREVKKYAPVSVASGSLRASVLHTLSLIGATDIFDVIVTPEDVEHGKPAPDMFLLAAQKMGIPPSACLVLEDAELGFEAARRAKMSFAVVHPGQANARGAL
jgi:HAD superfamily hydrolase (TIGR01509 family)